MPENKQEAKKYLLEANGLYKKRLFVEALELFNKAKELDPTLFEAQFSIAKTHIRLGKPDESVSLFEEALLLIPEEKKMYYRVGFAGILYKSKYFASAYKATKNLFTTKIQAQKLHEILHFPIQAQEYTDVVNILEPYSEDEKKSILDKISKDDNISLDARVGLTQHIEELKQAVDWDAFDDDFEVETKPETPKAKESITQKNKDEVKEQKSLIPPPKKKKSKWWIWLLLLLLILGAGAFFGKDYALEYMAWEDAIKLDKVGTYKRYLRNYPNGEHADAANEKIEYITRDEAIEYGTTEAILEFLNEYPKSKLILSVPLKVDNKQGILKVRGYETLKEDYIFNGEASEERIKLLDGSKVEIQYQNDTIIYKPIIMTIDDNSEIAFGEAFTTSTEDATNLESKETEKEVDVESDEEKSTTDASANPVPINFAQTPPAHPDCTQSSQNAKMRCFEQKIKVHIEANLDIPGFQKLNLSKIKHKVPYYFVIDRNGAVSTIKVRATDPMIEENIKSSIQTLPTFIAGIQDDKPTAVSYNSEIVFSTAKKEIPSKRNETAFTKEEISIPVTIPQNLTIQMADRAPIYPGCEGNTGLTLVKCTSKKINNYISSTINHENLKGHGLPPGKQHAIISFRISNQGRIKNIVVNTTNEIIKNEISRTVKSLPYMSPALYEDTAAGINYKLTLDVDLSLE